MGPRTAPGSYSEQRFIQQHPVIRNHQSHRLFPPVEGRTRAEPPPAVTGDKRKFSVVEQDDSNDSIDIEKILDTWVDPKVEVDSRIVPAVEVEDSSTSESEGEDEEDLDVEAAEEQIDRLDALISHWERLLERRRELDKAEQEEKRAKEVVVPQDVVDSVEPNEMVTEGNSVGLTKNSTENDQEQVSAVSVKVDRVETPSQTPATESEDRSCEETQRLLAEHESVLDYNRMLAQKHVVHSGEDTSHQSVFASFQLPNHSLPSSFIIDNLVLPHRNALKAKIEELRLEYESRLKAYKRKVARLNSRRTFGESMFGYQGPNPPALTPSGNEAVGSGPSGTHHQSYSSRSRRGGASDMVRSEAEFEAILRQLQQSEPDPAEAKQDRWAKNVDMVLDPQLRAAMEIDDRSRLVEDPVKELDNQRAMSDEGWTGAEKYIFRTKLAQYGKDFNIISKYLPNKSTQDCVFFYYRGKYLDGLKDAVRRHKIMTGQGRRKKQTQPKPAKPPDRALMDHDGGEDFDAPPVGRTRGSRTEDSAYNPPGGRAARAKQRAATQAAAAEEEEAATATRMEDGFEGDEGDETVTWTSEEQDLIMSCFRRYGKDFAATAEHIEGKTERDVRMFFNSQKRRLKLTELVKEAESEKKGKKGRSGRDKKKGKRKTGASEEGGGGGGGGGSGGGTVEMEGAGEAMEGVEVSDSAPDSKSTTHTIMAAAQALQGLLEQSRGPGDGDGDGDGGDDGEGGGGNGDGDGDGAGYGEVAHGGAGAREGRGGLAGGGGVGGGTEHMATEQDGEGTVVDEGRSLR
ncbi:nuclear receptor co-repressor 1 [Gonapodya sp. JEL0774]|nr:nuclear receptor co-repressor 1 [Gonapodya sp. JEL0774]